MGTLYLCKHDCSDDDCYRCELHGFIFNCSGCPDFDDVRNDMPQELKEMREQIMKEHGMVDRED